MAVLRFKNKKYVVQLLRAFTDKKQVTFEISGEALKIYTLAPPFFSLCIPNTLYEINQPAMFTMNAGDLLLNIDLLDADIVVLDKSFKMVTALDASEDDRIYGLLVDGGAETEEVVGAHNCSFIDIPFVGPIRSSCKQPAEPSTRLIIGKNILKSFLCGNVTYSNEDCLVLRKSDSVSEEAMKIDVEYLEKGYLDFCCSNDWVGGVGLCIEMVSTVLLGFAEETMCVKLLFAGQRGVYMEIQVPEKIGAADGRRCV